MTRKTYCGNLLWQSGLTLLPPRNIDTSAFPTSGSNDMSARHDEVELGRKFQQPFGGKAGVIVHKGGATQVVTPRYANLNHIYKRQSFTVPTGATMKYLEPWRPHRRLGDPLPRAIFACAGGADDLGRLGQGGAPSRGPLAELEVSNMRQLPQRKCANCHNGNAPTATT